MTDNPTNKGKVGSGSALVAFDSPDDQAGRSEELTEIDDLPEEPTEIDDDDSGGDGDLGTGAVSGGLGFAAWPWRSSPLQRTGPAASWPVTASTAKK